MEELLGFKKVNTHLVLSTFQQELQVLNSTESCPFSFLQYFKLFITFKSAAYLNTLYVTEVSLVVLK